MNYKLTKKQIKLCEKYAGEGKTFWDFLTEEQKNALKSIKWHETLHFEVSRCMGDYYDRRRERVW